MKLTSSEVFWPIRAGLPANYPPLLDDVRCDVAIIGAGVSGACVAWHLIHSGFDTVVLDRRDVAMGSTAASTSLLQYEIDVSLDRLAEMHGWNNAVHAYRRSREAIRTIERLVDRFGESCGFERKSSLRLASQQSHVTALRREFEARQRAGFNDTWWTRSHLEAHSTLPHPAAILSPVAGQIDPFRFTHALLAASARAGARIFDRSEVTGRVHRPRGVTLTTARGARVHCRFLVIAAGYEADVPVRMTEWRDTYALVSEPVSTFHGWPARRCLIWETRDPYIYLRTTRDGRIMIGGGDEPYSAAPRRDRRIARKSAFLVRRFQRLFPDIALEPAYCWAGTFARTADGLPWIGRQPGTPHTWVALGYGGNGITYSVIAAEMIRDEIRGKKSPDSAVFGFDRASVR